MIYGYLRVSTDAQDLMKQKYGLLEFAHRRSLSVNEIIEEKISSKVSVNDRLLGGLLDKLANGDILIIPELSRLGRSLYGVMSILSTLMEKDVKILIVKGEIELGKNIQSQVLAFAFSLASEIERELIASRTKESLAKLKSEGIKLGRPIGSKSKSKLDHHESDIKTYLSKGVSKRSISRLIDCSPSCLNHFIHSRRLHLKSG